MKLHKKYVCRPKLYSYPTHIVSLQGKNVPLLRKQSYPKTSSEQVHYRSNYLEVIEIDPTYI